MLRWMCEGTLIMGKVRGNSLRWFGRIMRRDNSEAVRIVMKINVVGRKGRKTEE